MNKISFLRFVLCTGIYFFPFKIIQCQVCTGSLGDPAVNITFGNSAGSASSYVPTSGYTYIASDCPNDGFYTITKSTSGCFGNTWHTVAKDHTGNGNFMLVNASIEPGDFFLTNVTNLCPNTTYEFSGWICNVMMPENSITPDVVFTIEQPDGTILGSYDSGPIPVTHSPEWVKYGLLFTTPADNATIVLRMRNNSPGGYGNDLALDDIGFRPCGPQVSAFIQDNADTVNLCEGDTVPTYYFSGNASSAYQNPFYQWQESINEGESWQDIAGATGTTYASTPPSAVGKYWYRLTVTDEAFAGTTSCRIASNLLKITIHPKPLADAGADRIYIKDYPVTLNGAATGEDVSFMWKPPLYIDDAASLTPVVTPPVDIIYTLAVQSIYNCKSSDDVQVKVADGIFVPNAFTPNNDGLNDYWKIPYLDIGLGADVKVFNRWGKMVYHVIATPVSWNGKVNGIDQPSGTYVYMITFKDNKLPQLKGTFTLMR